jgi:hypothetical protein
MKNIIRCELVQLHTVNEKKPMKKFVGRERETTQEKGVEHHPVLHRGLRMTSVLGKILQRTR